jgi:recombination protein RecA
MIHGKESTGKTTIALHCAAETQRQGGLCVYADSEHKLDPDYARDIGVDLERLILVQPDHLGRFFTIIERTIDVARRHRSEGSDFPALVILDSVNSLGTKVEMDADWDSVTVAQAASFYSAKLKKLVPMISRENVALLFISQERERINVVYGKKEQTGGGRALRFFSSLMLEVFRTGSVKEGEVEIGNETKVRCAKNQIAPPFREAEFRIIYGKGVDYDDSLVRESIRLKQVDKAGAWYSFQGDRIGQGIQSITAKLRSEPEFRQVLKEAVTRHG